jgi:hypothetical protein
MRDAVGGGSSIGTQLVDCPIAQQLRLPFRPRVQREPVVLRLRFLEDRAYLQSLVSASVSIPRPRTVTKRLPQQVHRNMIHTDRAMRAAIQMARSARKILFIRQLSTPAGSERFPCRAHP